METTKKRTYVSSAERSFKKENPEAYCLIKNAGLGIVRHDRAFWVTGCGGMRQITGYEFDEDGTRLTPEISNKRATEKVKKIIESRTKLLMTSLNDRFENMLSSLRKTSPRRGFFVSVQDIGGDKATISEFVNFHVNISFEGSTNIDATGSSYEEALINIERKWRNNENG